MRDEWYSDHLDLVKWAIVYRLASDHGLDLVKHIAFFRPSEAPILCMHGGPHDVDPTVWNFFRDWKRMEKKALGDLQVRIFDQIWLRESRAAYVDAVVQWLEKESGPTIILLDPDTGLEPASGKKPEHISKDEVKRIWDIMDVGSLLLIYQHAPRGKNDWTSELLNESYKDLAIMLGGTPFQVAHRGQDHPRAAIFWSRK